MVQGFKLVAFFYQISGAIPYLRAISIVKSVCMLASRSSPLALGGEICVAARGACLGMPFRIFSALQSMQTANWLACNQSKG